MDAQHCEHLTLLTVSATGFYAGALFVKVVFSNNVCCMHVSSKISQVTQHIGLDYQNDVDLAGLHNFHILKMIFIFKE